MRQGPTAANLLAAVLDLARKVESYEASAMKLGMRLRQPDVADFTPIPWSAELQQKAIQTAPRDFATAMLAIDEMRRRLGGIDIHMGAMRAHLDAIANDADQRLVFRSWMKSGKG